MEISRRFIRVTTYAGIASVLVIGSGMALTFVTLAASILCLGFAHFLLWILDPAGTWVAVAAASSWITVLFLKRGEQRIKLLHTSAAWLIGIAVTCILATILSLLGWRLYYWIIVPPGEFVGELVTIFAATCFIIWLAGEIFRRILRIPEQL